MDFYEAIKTRRSVRSYKPDTVPEDVLKRILNAARIAPSGGNRQPTRLIAVRDDHRKEALVPLCNGQKFITQAPVILVACGWEIPTNRGGYMGKYSMLVDVAIAVDHLTLAARAEGIGTCWIGSFDNAGIKQFLDVPDNYQVVALIPLGYPVGEPFQEITNRMPIEQSVCNEVWEF